MTAITVTVSNTAPKRDALACRNVSHPTQRKTFTAAGKSQRLSGIPDDFMKEE
jgi:hypothetical protein